MTFSDRDRYEHLVEELYQLPDFKDLLTSWERTFIESIGTQLSHGRELTFKQAEVLVRLHSKFVV